MAAASVISQSADMLNFLQNKELQGSDHLTKMSKLVSAHKQKTIPLKNPARATWTIGNLHDTIYRKKDTVVNGWNKFYLPEIVTMQVVGVVKGTPYPCDQLVLMTCEDERLYAYDGEELHLVASSMTQLSDKGIKYPADKSYYKGEAFKEMTDKDWDTVKNGAVGQRLDKAHHKLVTEKKSNFLSNLRSIRQKTVTYNLTMTNREQKRREDFLIEEDAFRGNALLLIDKMVELTDQASDDVTALLDEILHSIFFLGRIRNPSFSPGSILRDDQILNELKKLFPRPFELYSSQLPTRTPFSCVLDMIVHLTGRENETRIIDVLRTLISDLELGESMVLISSTICVSHRTDKDPVKYYGVSMSAPGRSSRKIMIAASCLSSWDTYVAGAVMTYFPTKRKKIDFDGTIQLPKHVSCQAFDLLDTREKPPCRSCGNLFGLTTSVNDEWVYGNCAEVESLSNLFKDVNDVKEKARPTSAMYSDEKRGKVEKNVRSDLINALKNWKFTWKGDFYTPQ